MVLLRESGLPEQGRPSTAQTAEQTPWSERCKIAESHAPLIEEPLGYEDADDTFDASQAVEDLIGFAANDSQRFPIGYSLDDTCGMVGPGELALLWARSGSGKSTFTLNVIANSPKVPTAVFNMEMTPRRQMEWLVPMTFDLQAPARELDDVLREGEHNPSYAELVSALRAMPKRYPNLTFIGPEKAPSVTDLAMKVDEIEDRSGVRPERVFIDHLTLMKGARDYEGVTTMAAQLHRWAMQEGLAVFALQQTGRGGGDGMRNDGHVPITLSSGIYAGEHDADWIFGLHRPEKDPRFKKERWEFKTQAEYDKIQAQYESCRGVAKLQLVKNRPYGEVRDFGIDLHYVSHSRRLVESGGHR